MNGRFAKKGDSRVFLAVLQLLLISACGSTDAKKVGATDNRPNIIWIIAEDLSPDLGCYGNRTVQTPNLDDLAGHGTRYTHAFATAPACSPSRTALITGYYQTGIGAHHMRYPDSLRPSLPTGLVPMHVQLKKGGYQTANIKTSDYGNGKTDWLFDYDPDTYGMSRWEELRSDRPFFARIALGLTHRVFGKDTLNPVAPDQVELPPYYPDHPIARQDWAGYLESVQLLDGQVHGILADLRERDLLENTLVFFFSDHGRPMSRGKNYLYESGLKIPLIIGTFDQKVKEEFLTDQRKDDRLISLIDLTATTLSLAGIDTRNLQGTPFLSRPESEQRQFVYGAVDRVGEIFFKSRSVRNRRFKYIRNFNHGFSVNSSATAYRRANHPIYHLLDILNGQGKLDEHQLRLVRPMEPEEFYDLENDPYELHNLINSTEWSGALTELRYELNLWMDGIDDKGMLEDSPEVIAAFKAYGVASQESRAEAIDRLRKEVETGLEQNEP